MATATATATTAITTTEYNRITNGQSGIEIQGRPDFHKKLKEILFDNDPHQLETFLMRNRSKFANPIIGTNNTQVSEQLLQTIKKKFPSRDLENLFKTACDYLDIDQFQALPYLELGVHVADHYDDNVLLAMVSLFFEDRNDILEALVTLLRENHSGSLIMMNAVNGFMNEIRGELITNLIETIRHINAKIKKISAKHNNRIIFDWYENDRRLASEIILLFSTCSLFSHPESSESVQFLESGLSEMEIIFPAALECHRAVSDEKVTSHTTGRFTTLRSITEKTYDPVNSPLTEIGMNLSLSFLSLCLSDNIARGYDPSKSDFDSFFRYTESELPPPPDPSPQQEGERQTTERGGGGGGGGERGIRGGYRDAMGGVVEDSPSTFKQNGMSLILNASVALLIYRCSEIYVASSSSSTSSPVRHGGSDGISQAGQGAYMRHRENALRPLFFEYLHAIITSDWFCQSRPKELCCQVLDRLFEVMIRDSDKIAHRYQSSQICPFWPLETPFIPSRLETVAPLDDYFFDLIAAVYIHIPAMAIKFWDNPDLKSFLETAGFARQPSQEYLRMIGSLGRSEEGAWRAYNHLDKVSHSGYLSWGYFVKWLRRYLEVYPPKSDMVLSNGRDNGGGSRGRSFVGGFERESSMWNRGGSNSGGGSERWGRGSSGSVALGSGGGGAGGWDQGRSGMWDQGRRGGGGRQSGVNYHSDYNMGGGGGGGGGGPGVVSLQQVKRAEAWVGHLVAFLQMMQSLLKNSERNREELGINKKREWGILKLLFDLFLRSESLEMKVEAIRTLGTFAKSKKLIQDIWSLLEGVDPRVIKQEFERDQRDGSYSLTLSFIRLIHNLVKHSLGHPGRHKGSDFMPYLDMLMEIFRDYQGYRYGTHRERWMLGGGCLKVFVSLLERYDPRSDMLPATVDRKKNLIQQSPGMKLLEKLVSNELTPHVRFVIKAAATGITETDDFKEKLPSLEVERGSGGALEYEKALRFAMKLIYIMILKENDFVGVLRWAENPVNAPDVHIVLDECVEYLTYFVNYPYDDEICLFSVRIIDRVCRKNSVSVVKMFMKRPDRERKIITDFHKRLLLEEALDPEELEEMEEEDAGGVNRRVLTDSVRYTILKMILDNIRQPNLNISHFLLGFRLQTELLGSRKHTLTLYDENALGSIIFWIQNKTSLTHPELIECCFEILHCLCSDERTSADVLKLLRNRWKDFYLLHLRHFGSGFGGRDGRSLKSCLRQAACFFQIIALEIHTTSRTDQRSGGQDCKRMLNVLFDSDLLSLSSNPHYYPSSPLTYSNALSETPDLFPQKMNLLSLLDPISLHVTELDDSPFKPLIRAPQLTACQIRNRQGVLLYDVHLLHKAFTQVSVKGEEGNRHRGGGGGGIGIGIGGGGGGGGGGGMIESPEQIRELLAYAIRLNESRQLMAARNAAICGWKCIVEVSLVNCLGVLLTSQRQPLAHSLLDLIAPLLRILSEYDRGLVNEVSETVLLLMTKIREIGLSGEGALPADRLLDVLRGILNGILRAESSQHTRGYLYASLLNYLYHTSVTMKAPRIPFSDGDVYDGSMEEVREQQRALEHKNLMILNEYGAPLVEHLCVDTVDSAEVWKATALATLTALCTHGSAIQDSFSANSDLPLEVLDRRGLVRHFVDDVSKGLPEGSHNDQRSASLKQNAQYTFESKMSLLTSLALTEVGARVVVDNGVLGYLATMEFPSHLSEYPTPRSVGPFSKPEALSSSERLLSPVLRLLSTLLMRFPKSEEVVRCVSLFLDRHYEALGVILKDAVGWVSVQTIGVLEAVVGVVYLVCRSAMIGHFERAHYYRLRVLRLLSKYLSSEWCRYVYGVLSSSHRGSHSPFGNPSSSYSLSPLPSSSSSSSSSASASSSFTCPLPIIDAGTHPITPSLSKNAHICVSKALVSLHSTLLACCRVFTTSPLFRDPMQPFEGNFVPIFSSDLDPPRSLEQANEGPSLGLCISFLQICAQQMIPFDPETDEGRSFDLILEHLLVLIWRHLEFGGLKDGQFSRNDILYQAEEAVLKHPPYRDASGSSRFVQLIIDEMRKIRF